MDDSLLAVLKSLVAAGPVAAVLGVVCYTLWQQNHRLMERLERQQAKMLKLAVRVQRAVEALAGLQAPPDVERDLEDDES